MQAALDKKKNQKTHKQKKKQDAILESDLLNLHIASI